MGIIVVPQLVALAPVGSNLYALTTANSKLHVVDASNPAALVETINYDLHAVVFAVAQFDPSAIVSHPPSSHVYIQNASEGLPKPMIFAIYDVSNPLIVTQGGTISFGNNLSVGANGGNDLVIAFPLVYSLLGGDAVANAAQLNIIDVSVPAAPAVVGGPISIGTFNDKPRKLFLVGTTLYVLSGTSGVANQKVFVYDVSNPLLPVLTTTLAISDASALVGLRNFFVDQNTLSMMAGTGLAGNVNLVVYSTAGMFLGSANVTSGVAGTAIVQHV